MSSTSFAAPARRAAPFAAILVAALVGGCATGPRIVTPDPPPIPQNGPPVPTGNAAVLDPGEQIVAKTAAGQIKIEAGPGLRRIYTWDGQRRGAILKPRDKPFAGASGKGLYFNGKPKTWAPAKGITRLRAEEGKRNFDNVDDAKIWMQIRRLYYAYDDNGLAVGWKRQGDTLHVELWQITIDGKQPTQLAGADDSAIQTGPAHAVAQKMTPQLVFADGHTEPYNTITAKEYPNAHVGGVAGGAAAGGSPVGTWFQQHIVGPIKRLFGGETESTPSTAGGATAKSVAFHPNGAVSAADTGTGATTGAADSVSASDTATQTKSGSDKNDDSDKQ